MVNNMNLIDRWFYALTYYRLDDIKKLLEFEPDLYNVKNIDHLNGFKYVLNYISLFDNKPNHYETIKYLFSTNKWENDYDSCFLTYFTKIRNYNNIINLFLNTKKIKPMTIIRLIENYIDKGIFNENNFSILVDYLLMNFENEFNNNYYYRIYNILNNKNKLFIVYLNKYKKVLDNESKLIEDTVDELINETIDNLVDEEINNNNNYLVDHFNKVKKNIDKLNKFEQYIYLNLELNWDFNKLSSNKNITSNLVSLLINKDWNFKVLTGDKNLIDEYLDLVIKYPYKDWNKEIIYKYVSLDFIINNNIRRYDMLYENPNLTVNYINKNICKDNYCKLNCITNSNLTIKFIEENIDYLDLFQLTKNKLITLDFIMKYPKTNRYDKSWDWDYVISKFGDKATKEQLEIIYKSAGNVGE